MSNNFEFQQSMLEEHFRKLELDIIASQRIRMAKLKISGASFRERLEEALVQKNESREHIQNCEKSRMAFDAYHSIIANLEQYFDENEALSILQKVRGDFEQQVSDTRYHFLHFFRKSIQ